MGRSFRKTPIMSSKSATVGDQIQDALNMFATELGRVRGSDITIIFNKDSGIRREWFAGDSYRYEFTCKLVERSLLDPSIVLHDNYYRFSTFHKKGEPFDFCNNRSLDAVNSKLDGTSNFAIIHIG